LTAQSAPGARRLGKDAERNRVRVLAAAREEFAERGVDATLDDIAARAGVGIGIGIGIGIGTVYRRYRNKSALLDELFEDRIDELARLAERSLEHPDAWQAFVDFLERVTELFAADRALEDLVVRSDVGPKRIALARDRLQSPVAELVERAKSTGRLSADFDQSDLAMIHTMLAAVVQETSEHEPDRWRRYFDLLIRGLDGAEGRRPEP
jgi:AcrR family transcriptional regulator